jgi:hypothetical protein
MTYALHQVHIKKPISIEDAYILSQQHIQNKRKKKVLENKQHYKFEHLARKHFQVGSFKKIKVDDTHQLVVGMLKPEHSRLEGSGLFSYLKEKASNVVHKVKEIFKPRLDGYNNKSRKVMETYGNLPISSIVIKRTPIASALNTALNLISLGKWNSELSKNKMDTLFHLALIVTINGKEICVEKNASIELSTSYSSNSDTQVQRIPLHGKQLILNEVLETARKNVGDKTFFDYDPFTNNCQYFIKYLLEGVHLYGSKEKDFLFQDLSVIVRRMPSYVGKIAKGVTTLGAIVDKITGKGKEPNNIY